LIYFDAHADLNLPERVPEGALDWMGTAHMLGESGAAPELAKAGSRTPLLDPEQLVLFGWDPGQATEFEREAITRRAISVVAVDEVAADPEGAATRARELAESRCDRLLVHFDVDVIAGLTVTELNPDHTEQGAATLERFTTDLSRCIGEALASRGAADHSQAGDNA
jgi:arginase